MRYAFASDFDNTFLFHEGGKDVFRPQDLSAVAAFRQNGGLFGFCTGRNYTGITDFVPPEVTADFMILSTGAHIVLGGDILHEKAIPYDVATALIAYGQAHDYPEISAQLKNDFYIVGDASKSAYGETPTITDAAMLRGKSVHTISYHMADAPTAAATTAVINAQFAPDVIAYQNTVDIDIVPRGCSKGDGIRRIREALGVDRFGGMGDSMNDLPMIAAVDVGFTFSDAPDGLQKNAAHIVSGVAEALSVFTQSHTASNS